MILYPPIVLLLWLLLFGFFHDVEFGEWLKVDPLAWDKVEGGCYRSRTIMNNFERQACCYSGRELLAWLYGCTMPRNGLVSSGIISPRKWREQRWMAAIKFGEEKFLFLLSPSFSNALNLSTPMLTLTIIAALSPPRRRESMEYNTYRANVYYFHDNHSHKVFVSRNHSLTLTSRASSSISISIYYNYNGHLQKI